MMIAAVEAIKLGKRQKFGLTVHKEYQLWFPI